MSDASGSSFLRRVLVADAVISGASGLMMAIDARMLEGILGLPAALLRPAGLSLLPFAAALLYLCRRDPLPAKAVRAVIAANGAWVAASVLVLLTGWVEPNRLGAFLVLAQAAGVAVLAEMQYAGLRASRA